MVEKNSLKEIHRKNSRRLEKRPNPMGPGASSRPLLTSGGGWRGGASVLRHDLGSGLGLRKRRRLSAGAVARGVVEKTASAASKQKKHVDQLAGYSGKVLIFCR